MSKYTAPVVVRKTYYVETRADGNKVYYASVVMRHYFLYGILYYNCKYWLYYTNEVGHFSRSALLREGCSDEVFVVNSLNDAIRMFLYNHKANTVVNYKKIKING